MTETIVDAGGRLGVPIHAHTVGPATLFSALPGRSVATVASPEALVDTSVAFVWFHGALEDRAALASSLDRPRTVDDAALVAAAWGRRGPDALKDIYGDYSVVVGERTGRIVAAVTPGYDAKAMLYATVRDGVLAWATHPSLLLARNVECDPDYFVRWYRRLHTAERTPYRGVLRVSGGHFIALPARGGALESGRWWKPPVGTLALPTERDYEQALRDTVRASVERATRGHRRVAISLTAGIDSASIAVCARDLARSATIDAPFGLTFATDDPLSDESPFGEAMAAHLGISHRRTPAPVADSLDDVLDASARAGFPTGHVLLGGWHRTLAETAVELGATIVLNGAGGEALVAEIDDAWRLTEDASLRELVATARGAIACVGPRALAKAAVRCWRERADSRHSKFAARQPWLRAATCERLGPWRAPGPVRTADELLTMMPNACESHDRVYLSPLPIADRAPYLDRRVLELAYALPHWLRLRRTPTLLSKTLARNAFPEVPVALSRQGARVSLNHAVAQSWRSLLDVESLRALVAALPPSFGGVLDVEQVTLAMTSLSDLQTLVSAHDVAATALWVEGMRRAGWVMT